MHVRVRLTIRINQSVAAEIVVAGIKIIEIASVCINHLVVFTIPADTLIYEVPDESSLIFRVFADDVPVFLETTL